MSTKFFQSVRRNQKQWMVVVTVLSMVSFLFLDSVADKRGPLSPIGGGIMIGILCGAGMCIVGYPRQKTTEFGLSGLAVGFVAGLLGFGAMGVNKPIVRTPTGNLTRKDLMRLHNERQKLNQFLYSAARKAQNPYFPGIGGLDEQSLVRHQMLLVDARKMGIRVGDDRVVEYLKDLTQGRLKKDDYLECLREAHLGETEMFELMKEVLSVSIVFGLSSPPAYTPPIMPQLAQRLNQSPESLSYMQPTPFQLWSMFEKLNVTESLQAAAFPVRDFMFKVGDPDDKQLNAFFDRYKARPWRDESQPGFLLPPRVQLAYLTADYEKWEQGLEPTDQEIADHYDSNKERYRAPLPKKSTAPKLPEATSDQPESTEEKKPENEDQKPEEKAPEPEAKQDQPANGDIVTELLEQSQKQAGENQADEAQNPKSAQPATEKPADEKPAGEEAAAEEKPAAEKPAQPGDAEKPAESKADPAIPPSPDAPPATEFRPLDDQLKLEIRDELLRERTFAKIASELDKAREFMVNLGIEYDGAADKAKKEEKVKSIVEQVKKYAEEHNLEYVETPALSYEDLASDPIGLAFETKSGAPVAQELFSPGPHGESRVPLYAPRRADLKSHHGAFSFWKIAELPSQFSDLKDADVRTRAVTSWKFDQARSLAEKRANELLKKVKLAGNDVPAALSGESVTGDPNDPAISIISTDPFTWLTTNRSVPGAPQDPQISRIPLIDNISNEFMRTVFEDLNDGDVGVVADDPRAVFYLVKVLNRETSQNDDGGVARQERQKKFLKEKFDSPLYPIMKSPYQSLAQQPQQQINQLWQRNFEQAHQMQWEENLTPSQRSRN